MFQYVGRSEGFRKAVEEYAPRLERIYRELLRRDFDEVRRLTTPGLFYTPERGQATAKSIKGRIDEFFERRHVRFFVNSADMMHLNETVTREMDRRVLGALGYHDTESWVDYMSVADKEPGLEGSRRRDRIRQRNLARSSGAQFMDFLKNWDAYMDEGLVANMLQSCRRYRVQKITAEHAGGIEALISSERSVAMTENLDNMAGAALLKPPRDKIRISDDGEVELIDTSRFLTAPTIVLSDDGVDMIRDKLAPDLPPYLVALVHEFDHIVGYCIQRYPMFLAATLLHLKAEE